MKKLRNKVEDLIIKKIITNMITKDFIKKAVIAIIIGAAAIFGYKVTIEQTNPAPTEQVAPVQDSAK